MINWRYFSKLSHRYHRQKKILIELRTPVQIGNCIFFQKSFYDHHFVSFDNLIHFIRPWRQIDEKIWTRPILIPKWHCDQPIPQLGCPRNRKTTLIFPALPKHAGSNHKNFFERFFLRLHRCEWRMLETKCNDDN